MEKEQDRLDAMSDVIKREHAGQTRQAGTVPYWHHCERVAETLVAILKKTGEADAETFLNIVLGAKGHDLYEDTKVNPLMIAERFGARVNELIESVTNRKGDADRSEYVGKVRNSSEEARLIKLADLYDNYLDGYTGIYTEGAEWAKNFLKPILDEMWENISKTKFDTYKKTAEKLFKLVESARTKFLGELEKFNA